MPLLTHQVEPIKKWWHPTSSKDGAPMHWPWVVGALECSHYNWWGLGGGQLSWACTWAGPAPTFVWAVPPWGSGLQCVVGGPRRQSSCSQSSKKDTQLRGLFAISVFWQLVPLSRCIPAERGSHRTCLSNRTAIPCHPGSPLVPSLWKWMH